jgi:hypothetical protein
VLISIKLKASDIGNIKAVDFELDNGDIIQGMKVQIKQTSMKEGQLGGIKFTEEQDTPFYVKAKITQGNREELAKAQEFLNFIIAVKKEQKDCLLAVEIQADDKGNPKAINVLEWK